MENVVIIKGIKYYPVGSWEKHQHKFYNYHDVCYLKMVDSDYADSACRAFEEADTLIDLFDSMPQRNGIVYAPYETYKRLKAVIDWYNNK